MIGTAPSLSLYTLSITCISLCIHPRGPAYEEMPLQEWAERDRLSIKSGEPIWGNLTMVITHQWLWELIHGEAESEEPDNVIRHVIETVMPIKDKWARLHFQQNRAGKKFVLSERSEERVYLYTHLVLVASNWGGELSPLLERKHRRALTKMFSAWFSFLSRDRRLESYNREIVVELAAVLLVMLRNGSVLSSEVRNFQRQLRSAFVGSAPYD